ncbi:MAG: hypothetical protein IJ206_08895 [Oscillospiraceae bacterium]|nr:hypothetical protein [Oscillospiraceae bacterium]
MKRTLSILLAVIMLLSLLTACGGKADPNIGVYKLSGAMGYSLEEFAGMMGITEEEAADMIQMELKDKGVLALTFDGETETGTWSADGETLTIEDAGESITGTIKDGVITIEIEGESMTLTKVE